MIIKWRNHERKISEEALTKLLKKHKMLLSANKQWIIGPNKDIKICITEEDTCNE